MPRPRYAQVSLEDTPFYHCISRCVRRAFLCGVDDYSGKSYEHRRDWVESRLLELAAVFAIDLCAYAVMSNHLHLVLRVDLKTATEWTLEQVLQRWHLLYSGTLLSQRFLRSETLSDIEYLTLQQTTEVYRQRLMDISWFMRALNEPIATNIQDILNTLRATKKQINRSQLFINDDELLEVDSLRRLICEVHTKTAVAKQACSRLKPVSAKSPTD
ncbi:hypothetical protein TUM17384_32200 [Shewanella algae]|nr:hypothetical protein TUM17384_32200 [Shewanella algae]